MVCFVDISSGGIVIACITRTVAASSLAAARSTILTCCCLSCGRARELMSKDLTLPCFFLRPQQFQHRIRDTNASIHATDHDARMKGSRVKRHSAAATKSCNRHGAVKPSQGPEFYVVFVDGDEGVGGLGEFYDRGGDADSGGGGYGVGVGGAEVGEADVAGGGGGGEKVRGEGVGGAEGEDVGCVEGMVEVGLSEGVGGCGEGLVGVGGGVGVDGVEG